MWLFLPPLLVLAFLPHMWRAAWRASRDTYGQANTRGRS